MTDSDSLVAKSILRFDFGRGVCHYGKWVCADPVGLEVYGA